MKTYSSLHLERVVWRSRRSVILEYRYNQGYPIVPIEPGEFVLFWVLGFEAIPLAPIPTGSTIKFFVVIRGETTRRIVEKPPINAGIIGPLGKAIHMEANVVTAIAGGAGIASLAPLVSRFINRGEHVNVFYGVRDLDSLPPLTTLLEPRAKVFISTDDGSFGYKGNVIDMVNTHLDIILNSDYIIAAGPQPMLCKLWESLKENKINPNKVLLSVETIVRCGLGFCGKCMIPCSRGILLCREGPFINGEVLECWSENHCNRSVEI